MGSGSGGDSIWLVSWCAASLEGNHSVVSATVGIGLCSLDFVDLVIRS